MGAEDQIFDPEQVDWTGHEFAGFSLNLPGHP